MQNCSYNTKKANLQKEQVKYKLANKNKAMQILLSGLLDSTVAFCSYFYNKL